jgi:hypothetical protein
VAVSEKPPLSEASMLDSGAIPQNLSLFPAEIPRRFQQKQVFSAVKRAIY